MRLIVPPGDKADEEGNVIPSPAKAPLKALVRIRIPLIRHTKKKDENENDENADGDNAANENEDASRNESKLEEGKQSNQNSATKKDGAGSQRDNQEDGEGDSGMQEAPIDDKVVLVNTVGE